MRTVASRANSCISKVKQPKKQSLIATYVNVEKKTQTEMNNRLAVAAMDRLFSKFNHIATSAFIRNALKYKNLVVHSSPNSIPIRGGIAEFFQMERDEMRCSILSHIRRVQ